MRPAGTEWDDPEEYPEDEDQWAEPGAPPQGRYENGPDCLNPVHDILPIERRLTPDIRERRRQRIEDMLRTTEYTERRKHELRRQRGERGRFS